MRTRIGLPLVLAMSASLTATHALDASWEVQWDEQHRACTVTPPGHGMAIAMREDSGERQSRVFVGARLEAGGVVYLRIDDGRQYASKRNFFEGAEAQAILNDLWTGQLVEIGASTGIRPIRVHDRLPTEGIRDAVNLCTERLGWSESHAAVQQPGSGGALVETDRPPPARGSVSEDSSAYPATPIAQSSDCDIADTLRNLGELRSEGLLTDEEFEDLKGRLLARCRAELGEDEGSSPVESAAAPTSPHPDESERPRTSLDESAKIDWSDPLRSLLGPYGAQNRSAINYEVRWVNGTSFVIGSTEDLQLWVAFVAGRHPQALIYLVNGSGRRITFSPESIQATVIRSGKTGVSRLPVRTFSATAYEKKVRNKQAWQVFLHGAAAGMANQPQPQQESFSGGYSSYRPLQPGSQLQGSFYGQITRWPTAADYAAARERTTAQVNAMSEQLHASFNAMAATLMRTHTLEPNSYYGGIVHFTRLRGKRVVLKVPFGGSAFVTEFTLP